MVARVARRPAPADNRHRAGIDGVLNASPRQAAGARRSERTPIRTRPSLDRISRRAVDELVHRPCGVAPKFFSHKSPGGIVRCRQVLMTRRSRSQRPHRRLARGPQVGKGVADHLEDNVVGRQREHDHDEAALARERSRTGRWSTPVTTSSRTARDPWHWPNSWYLCQPDTIEWTETGPATAARRVATGVTARTQEGPHEHCGRESVQ